MAKKFRHKQPDQQSGGDCTFGSFFTSKKGNVFYAADYGHKAWPFHRRKRQ